MFDFSSSFNGSDFDWEFNAPHWFDFEKEDTENPDGWFEEQEKEMEKKSHMIIQSRFKIETGDQQKTKHPTRIPVHDFTRSKAREKRTNITESADLSKGKNMSKTINSTNSKDSKKNTNMTISKKTSISTSKFVNGSQIIRSSDSSSESKLNSSTLPIEEKNKLVGSKFYSSKLPVRVPLKEKRNSYKQ